MLKGTRKLNKTISNELSVFGITKCILGTEYSYSYDKNDIMYKIDLDIEDKYFSDFIFDRFGYDDTGMEFIISLLHEVGHSKANDEIEGSIFDFCMEEKNRIFKEMETAETDEEVRKLEYQYFNLPDEIMATAWAIKYVRQHPIEVQIMWAVMKEAILNFYKANGLFQDTEV